tara:strand:+ start:142 stop:252 length:111 start_codon:yes stop_codon:yes gene_type:complete
MRLAVGNRVRLHYTVGQTIPRVEEKIDGVPVAGRRP